ncbi:VirB3 family type IV secretion system protein [Vibrio scophthalmi]|uniref:VirB3 family type IV secretion system protein n=1 Tax=Vibrio scophthalmi TaxID=45658 RepID=UPI00084970CA
MSKVYKSITRPQLLLMLPKDYLVLLAVLALLLFYVVWFGLYIPKLIPSVYTWTIFLLFIAIGWLIGAIKAKFDPEFFSVHISKWKIPAQSVQYRIDRYLNSVHID